MKKLIGNIFVSFFAISVYAQDVHFSQIQLSPLALNPALAGAIYDLEANVNYRNQWTTIGAAFQTISASVDTKLNFGYKRNKKAYFAIGIDFYNDQAGIVKVSSNNFNLHLASHIVLAEESTLGLAIQGGYGQRSIDESGGRWGNQYNGEQYVPSLPTGEQGINSRISYFDLGAGILYRYSAGQSRIGSNDQISFTAGFAAYHLTRPGYSFFQQEDERLYMRFSGFANMDIGISNSHIILQPGVYYFQQGKAREILLGIYWKYMLKDDSQITNFINQTSISLGLFYRNQDALIAKVLFDWRGLGIGFAYDINIFSSLTKASKSLGAFEVGLRYVFPDFTRRPYVTGGRSHF